MKKLILFLFVALLTQVFTSCKDDDVYHITDTDLNGVYLGTMDVDAPFGGVQLGADDIKQKIYITKTGENLVTLQLKDFTFNNIPIGTLEITNVEVDKVHDDFKIEGTGKLTLIVGGCDIAVNGTVSAAGKCNIVIEVKVTSEGQGVNFVGLNVTVDFTGDRLAADKSSEALIKEFIFNSDSISDVIIADKTIEFYALENTVNYKFKPTITISEGATITPAADVEQDFSSPVIYTVTSEDGIVVNKYTVSEAGKVKYMDFEVWKKDNTYGFEKPEGSFASTNEGSGIVYSILEGLKSVDGFQDIVIPSWCVSSSEEGKTGKAAVLETIDLTPSKADLLRYKETLSSSDAVFIDYVLGMCPNITAGSLFLGSFDLASAMGDPLKGTQFGIPYVGEPVKFSGWYKYTPGAKFYDKDGNVVEGQTDEFAIYALLYEAKGKDGKEVTLTGTDINTSEYIVLKAEVTDKTAKEDWTYFEIPFEKMNDKEYDAANQYKLALICTSSKEGDRYRGAPGSILMIDDLKITR